LKEQSGAFEFGHIVWEADEDGKKTGTIYGGSINNVVEVSANFCLTMHREFLCALKLKIMRCNRT
jgi:hypothetical protein